MGPFRGITSKFSRCSVFFSVSERILFARKHLRGEPTSTNPISSIYAWTRGLKHRAMLDKNYELDLFTKILEKACIETVEEDNLTKDLALCLHGPNFLEKDYLTTDAFMDVILKKLEYDLDKFLPNR